MTVDRNTLLFFDASCLIAAAGNPNGGSGFLLSICTRGFLKAAVSQPVLLEVQRNIQKKLGNEVLNRFYKQLAVVPFSMAPVSELSMDSEQLKKVNPKDRHVLAAVLAIRAPYVLTLDQGLLMEFTHIQSGITALTPGDFIRRVLPTHLEYPPL